MGEQWGIAQVAQRLGVDADTLRYYERRGVVPAPPRDGSGKRSYGSDDVHLLEVLMHLKGTGMSLSKIAEFTRLVAADPAGVSERLALLQEHREHVRAQLAVWTQSMDVIDGKIADYRRRANGGR